MVCRDGGFSDEQNAVSASLSDALILTTMCIVGLSVEAHVTDGSVFSGIFYTASVDDGYAIVLKKARMIKKGNQYVNIPNGSLVETLLVQAEDLVQVVAKGVPVPANGILGDFSGDDVLVIASNNHFPDTEATSTKKNESRADNKQCISTRQVKDALGVKQSNNKVDALHVSSLDRDVGSNISTERDDALANTELSSDLPSGGLSSATDKHDDQSTKDASEESPHSNGVPCVSTDATPTLHELRLGSSIAQNESMDPKTVIRNKPAKESKLNPRAKVFSPSPLLRRSMTPAIPPVASVTYIPDPSLMVSAAVPQPDYETSSIALRSSTPVKFIPNSNLIAANNATDLQYGHLDTTHAGNRVQPARFAGPFDHFQAAPTFVHPNSQNIMVGRMGPCVYLQPVGYDMQEAAVFSQLSLPPLLSQYQVHLPKHQGSVTLQAQQLCEPPPPLMYSSR